MRERTVVSLFSGIGALDEGLRRAGWEHALFCESVAYRRDVLRARFPGVPVYEDVRALREPAWRAALDRAGAPDDGGGGQAGPGLPMRSRTVLLAGGFPCQDVSVAGRRRGLAGDRSGLFYEFARVAEALRPRWVLIENVPGLLSSNGGRDFGSVLGTLADLGYGLAWRVLDSRFFGVPQRRRRVFIIGVLADGDPRAASERARQVLAVGSRCDRHPATRGEAGQSVAPTLGASVGGGRGWDANPDRTALIVHPMIAEGHDASEDGTGRGTPLIAAPLSHGSNPNSNAAGRRREDDENLVTAFDWQQGTSERSWFVRAGDYAQLRKGGGDALQQGATVRRLMPIECERLQALPDGWTDLSGTTDSRRYAALGDAVTATVAHWIGERIP